MSDDKIACKFGDAEAKQGFINLSRDIDRIAVTFQFDSARVTWWQRKEDFEKNWEERAAEGYARCSVALLNGKIEAGDIPNISMGDLHIAIISRSGMAQVEVTYHDYNGRSVTFEARYSFIVPVALLAAAFSEAAARIRAGISKPDASLAISKPDAGSGMAK
jgi:hypothetical protein